MKNLTKILGLLAMMTLVSCGSGSPSKANLDKCINESICKDLGETPVVEELEFLVENFETVHFMGAPVKFFDTGNAGADFIRFRATGSSETGFGHVAFIEVALFENGVVWLTTTIDGLTWTRPKTWSITSDDELIIDGAIVKVTLKEAI